MRNTFVKMIAFQSKPLWKIKPLCPLFSYTTKPSQGKREKRKQKASREQQEWELGKYENYWGFNSFHSFPYAQKMFRFIFLCILFYVSRFLFACFLLVCSLLHRIFANVISRADFCQQFSNHNDCLPFRKQFPQKYFYACWGYCHSNQKVRNPESDYFLKHVLFEMAPSKII